MIKITEKTYGDIVKKVGQEKMNKIEQNNNKPATSEIVKVQPTRKESTFDHNTAKIIILHNSITSMLCKSLENAFEIGRLLFEQKEKITSTNGKFTSWASDKLPFSIRSAQRYMKLYQYQDVLTENNIQTITDAYSYIFGEPTSDEIIDADDSLNTTDITVKASVSLDKLKLPKRNAKGLMTKLVLTKSNIDDLISGSGYQDCQGKYIKIVVELKSGNIHNKRIGDFVCAAEKYLKHGGKIIFYKP